MTKFNVECPVWASVHRRHRIGYESCHKPGFGVICSSQSRPQTVAHRVKGQRTRNLLDDRSNTECETSGNTCFCKGGFAFGKNERGKEACVDINECVIGLSDCDYEERGHATFI